MSSSDDRLSPLVATALVEASETYLTVNDVDKFASETLGRDDPELQRIVGLGLICELVLNGYVDVTFYDDFQPETTAPWDAIRVVWEQWSAYGRQSIQGQFIAEFPLTPAGWDAAIRVGHLGGTREFIWEGEKYKSRGHWRQLNSD